MPDVVPRPGGCDSPSQRGARQLAPAETEGTGVFLLLSGRGGPVSRSCADRSIGRPLKAESEHFVRKSGHLETLGSRASGVRPVDLERGQPQPPSEQPRDRLVGLSRSRRSPAGDHPSLPPWVPRDPVLLGARSSPDPNAAHRRTPLVRARGRGIHILDLPGSKRDTRYARMNSLRRMTGAILKHLSVEISEQLYR